jgi:hypothetical protein
MRGAVSWVMLPLLIEKMGMVVLSLGLGYLFVRVVEAWRSK